ncbi:MAG: carboxypeptidase regulatory-like domain-containing protein [Thaumarchaeota archaeon]|nr:MAG: carboxypeptidase regulatory-like domain-containing protein [Nitrososphaerota archaeon]
MRGKTAALFLILLTMLFVCPGRTQAQVAPQQLDISKVMLGLSPSTLSPASQGLPVYTVGDALWATSHLGSSLLASLSSPNFSSSTTLDPGVVAPLHTFQAADISGNWSLRLSSSNASRTVAVQFVKQNQNIAPVLTSHGFSNRGDLLLNYTVNAGGAYDIQACVLGAEMPDAVQIPIPSAIGTGQLLLRRAGVNATVTLQGKLSGSSTFSFELHHLYSYTVLNSSGLVERDVKVATSATLLLSSSQTGNPTQNASITADAPMRRGRFLLRAFFGGSSGHTISETSVLIADNTGWVWLQGCTSTMDVTSSAFSFDLPLGASTADWPHAVYTMYRSSGVEGLSLEQVTVAPAVINVVAVPWRERMTAARIVVAPGRGIEELKVVNGTIYLTANHFPLPLNVSLAIGNAVFETQTLQVVQPYSIQELDVQAGRLDLLVRLNGSPALGARVEVFDQKNDTLTMTADAGGSASFLLPAGSYRLTADLGNETREAQFTIQDGQELPFSIEFENAQSQTLPYALAIAGVVGAGVSIWVWVKILMRGGRGNLSSR